MLLGSSRHTEFSHVASHQQNNRQRALSLRSDIRNFTGGDDFESKSRFC